jgi:hypothetical protein
MWVTAAETSFREVVFAVKRLLVRMATKQPQ